MRTLNLTEPRRAVLEVVRQANDHPTAAEIMERLAARGQRYAYATIYNSLRYLTEHGLLRELNLGNGISRYDGRLENHQHIVCVRCGAIAETLVDVPPELARRMEGETGYRVDQVSLHVTGLCPACQAKESATR
ncbi:MAG: transcriptional repressor [Alicyclobacillus sp.]|nr:transcriptional repressor [Alicyclobacillus sp.]